MALLSFDITSDRKSFPFISEREKTYNNFDKKKLKNLP